jgi:hypothetical protein
VARPPAGQALSRAPPCFLSFTRLLSGRSALCQAAGALAPGKPRQTGRAPQPLRTVAKRKKPGWEAFAGKYLTAADLKGVFAFYGYHVAIAMTHVLKECGDNLSRDNILRQALSLRDFTTPLLLPGITINASPTNYVPIQQFQLARFNGENWELFGDVLNR